MNAALSTRLISEAAGLELFTLSFTFNAEYDD